MKVGAEMVEVEVEVGSDSTIAPPQNQRYFFSRRFMAARHEEGCSETYTSMHFLVYEELSKYGIGVANGTVFQETRPGVGFKTGDFVKKSWGGYRRTTLGWYEVFFFLGGGIYLSCIAVVLSACIVPRIPAVRGTEHIEFSPTRQISRAPSTKRREVFGESRKG